MANLRIKNSLPEVKILDLSKKAFAEDTINEIKVENIEGKKRNDGFLYFLIFPE